MQELTVRTVYESIDRIAPFETAESYDNVGLLVGDWDARVDRILCTLDVTAETVNEARQLGAGLIVSHHPLMFHGRRTFIAGDPEAEVIRSLLLNGINLISAHTNWDQTALSGSASVALDLGITGLRQEGYLFTGEIVPSMTAAELRALIEERINAPVRMYGPTDRAITTVSFGGGAYGEGYMAALNAGAQAYLTGEIRHHEIIDSTARGLVIYDAGHYASEAPMISRLIGYLEKELEAYHPLEIIESRHQPFTGALIKT